MQKKEFGDIGHSSILYPLADHIAFSIDRIKNDMVISNPLTSDIRLLFVDEYEVATKARKIIKRRLGYEITDDEIGYDFSSYSCSLSSQATGTFITGCQHYSSDSHSYVEETFNIVIDEDSPAYIRLVNHSNFFYDYHIW